MPPAAALRLAGLPASSTRRRRSDEIILAAAEVFAAKGFHGASTQDVADRLGMRQASLYYYFSSKEAALEQVCLRSVGDFVERALEIANGPGTAAAKLTALVRRHLEPTEQRPAFVRCFIRERRFLPKESRRRVGRVARRYERIVQGMIEAGIAAGELRGDLDPRLAVLALLGMCNASVDWYGKEPGIPIDRIAENFARVALDGMAAQQAAEIQRQSSITKTSSRS
ncbi:MAG TPA: TetR/AcrR family transcriptional regulator [Stellaceae bacterium]|nr:TetR/AcrR family transcriptional regulator [Stellaceae bacterium]